VNKLFPQLDKIDDKKEEEYYKSRGFKKKQNYIPSKPDLLTRQIPQVPRDGGPASAEYICFKLIPSSSLPTNQSESSDSEIFELPGLPYPMLKTSGKVKVIQLKKYLAKKFKLEHRNEVNILYKTTSLGDEYTLFFIQRTLSCHQDEMLVLNYHRNAQYDIELNEF